MSLRDETADPLIPLTVQERVELLRLARHSITTSFTTGVGGDEPAPQSSVLRRPGAAFVSLHLSEVLRGCVGSMKPHEALYEVVMKNARAAAFEDPRFLPLDEAEAEHVEIEISRLAPLRRATPEEVVAGIHGVYVVQGKRRALLLPQVATKFGWNGRQLVRETCRKAGLAPEAWREPEVEIYVFLAEIFAESARPSV
jgi:uncharacterized protein